MAGWKIIEWDRGRGVGVTAGELDGHVVKLPVTRDRALVDDFFADEEVAVVLEADDRGEIVARDVAPKSWREDGAPVANDDVPASVVEAIAKLSSALGPHARVQIASAQEDVLCMEVHDVDWPPPVTPPIAKIAFEGVVYLKGPSFSEGHVRASVVTWRRFRAARAKILRYWSLGDDIVPDDALVFRFEPAHFGGSAGYVIAAAIDVALDPNLARRSL